MLGAFAVFPPQAALADGQVYWTDGVTADAAYAFSGGDGTSASTAYQIATAADLAQLAVNVNGGTTYSGVYFKLTADIDLNGKWWVAVGRDATVKFSGNFDGNGNTISNLTTGNSLDSPEAIFAGLFGYIYEASVSNLTLTGVSLNVSGCTGVGSLVGYAYASEGNTNTITNCAASGNITGDRAGACHIGGLIGYLRIGTATDCSADVNVTGDEAEDFVDGFTGRIYDGTIINCTASGNVTGGNDSGGFVAEVNSDSLIDSYSSSGQVTCGYYSGGFAGCCFGTIRNCSSSSSLTCPGDSNVSVGGLVGMLYTTGIICNSYCTGAVTAYNTASYAGGIIGASYGTISNCYATGVVTNGYGLADSMNSATINHSFWNTDSTAAGYPDGASFSGTGATGLVTADMKTADFLSGLNNTTLPNYTADWDTWRYMTGVNGGYPILSWQAVPVLTAGTATRTAQDTATVTFTANEAGAYYYEVVADGTLPTGPDTSGGGTACSEGENTISLTGLSSGAKDIYIVLVDADSKVSSALKMDIPKLYWTDGHDVDGTYAFSGGTGTSGDPYRIATAGDLAQLAVNVNNIADYSEDKYFKLTGVIDLTGSRWTPIGTGDRPFSGTFDGNGFTVSGLSVESDEYQYAGLFGYASGAAFKNLTVGGTVFNAYSVAETVSYSGDDYESIVSYAGGVVAYGVNAQF
ncbi:MAG: hypothetical protein EOM54_09595 [Clostridia bacterium]|nr:hypothetical protein [Clostridia bacterium]